MGISFLFRRAFFFAAVGSMLLLAPTLVRAVPFRPPLPETAWLFDEGSGGQLLDLLGWRSGSLEGTPQPTWSENTPFDYTGNHSLEFIPAGYSAGNYARLDGLNSPAAGTLSLWVTDNGTGQPKYITDTDGGRTLLYRGSATGSLNYYQNGTHVGSVSDLVPTDGSWTHVAVVWDNTASTEKQKLYKNGSLLTTFNVPFNAATQTVTYLGSRQSANETWSGKIDEYARWNTPLNANQIEWLAGNSLHDLATKVPAMPDDAWLFDEGAGTTTQSFVPGGGPGTLYSDIQWTTNTPLAYEGNHALLYDSSTNDKRVNFEGRTFGTEGTLSVWAYREPGAMYLFDSSNGDRTLFYSNYNWYLNNQSMPSLAPELMPNGEWTLLTITWDNSLPSEKQKVYSNGRLFATFDYTVTERSPAMLWLGNRYSNNEDWSGMIDEYAFWDHALSASEVRWLYGHSISEIPEPGTLGLTLIALAIGLFRFRRRT
ncbi:MAG: LamG domain-containing protein [Thermoguttaceae bacterium]|jgi:hypothetical protein|nr:LamG domain-containing protein [Thermoguttaceae bacterium]